MKNLIKHLPLLALIFISLSYTACSSDNTDEPSSSVSSIPSTPPESPEDNLPEEARAFVGFWVNLNQYGDDFLFFDDGICWRFDSNGSSHDYSPDETGYWTYNPATMILATTTSTKDWNDGPHLWQFEITLSNSEAWNGLRVGGSDSSKLKLNSFTRQNKTEYLAVFLNQSTWESDDDNTLILEDYTYHNCFSYYEDTSFSGFFIEGTIDVEGDFLEILEDDNLDDYTFKYNLRNKIKSGTNYRSYIVSSGTVTLLNPTKSTDHKLVFTGTIDKTLSRVENE